MRIDLVERGAGKGAHDETQCRHRGGDASGCSLLGFDPLHLANEGRLVAVVAAADRQRAEAVLAPGGGAWIGTVTEGSARVVLRTPFGSERRLLPPSGELLPRIC